MPTVPTLPIQIIVNGESRSVSEGATLLAVLLELGIEPDRVAVEKDLAIVRKAEWGNTTVQAGARLEIVQFVGGG